MNFNYKLQDMELEVYAGRLNKEVKLVEEINKLLWVDKNDNFFDIDKYAGEGNIGHMLRQVEIYKDEVLKQTNYMNVKNFYEKNKNILDNQYIEKMHDK